MKLQLQLDPWTAHMHWETREWSYLDSCVCLVRGLTLVSQKGLGKGRGREEEREGREGLKGGERVKGREGRGGREGREGLKGGKMRGWGGEKEASG